MEKRDQERKERERVEPVATSLLAAGLVQDEINIVLPHLEAVGVRMTADLHLFFMENLASLDIGIVSKRKIANHIANIKGRVPYRNYRGRLVHRSTDALEEAKRSNIHLLEEAERRKIEREETSKKRTTARKDGQPTKRQKSNRLTG